MVWVEKIATPMALNLRVIVYDNSPHTQTLGVTDHRSTLFSFFFSNSNQTLSSAIEGFGWVDGELGTMRDSVNERRKRTLMLEASDRRWHWVGRINQIGPVHSVVVGARADLVSLCMHTARSHERKKEVFFINVVVFMHTRQPLKSRLVPTLFGSSFGSSTTIQCCFFFL